MTEEELDDLRPSAFAIAYGTLARVGEAENVVQEGFPPSARGAPGRRTDRIAARLPVDGGLAALARPLRGIAVVRNPEKVGRVKRARTWAE
jgi:hypothetical protein